MSRHELQVAAVGSLSSLRLEAKHVGLRGRTRMSKAELLVRLNATPMLNESEVKDRGWTEKTIASILGEPDSTRPNRRYPNAAPVKLYRVSRVELAEASPKFQAFQASRRGQATPSSRAEIKSSSERFAETWPNWRDALPVACDYIFQLNRYAKNPACPEDRREKTYRLKNRMIELLWRLGFCSSCYIHQRTLPEKRCYLCEGSGWLGDAEYCSDSDDATCPRCKGTRVFLPAKTIRYYSFQFLVNGITYTWHQPQEAVHFVVTITETPQDWVERPESKSVDLGYLTTLEYTEVVAWLLSRADKELSSGQTDPLVTAASLEVPTISARFQHDESKAVGSEEILA